MKHTFGHRGSVRKTLAFVRAAMVHGLYGFVAAWLIAWALAVVQITGDTSRADESTLLNDGLERRVQIVMDRWFGRTRIFYSTSEAKLNDDGYARHDNKYARFSMDDDSDWSEALWFWNPTGFGGWGGWGGWGHRRDALRDGVGSKWAIGCDVASGFPALALWNSQPTSTSGLGLEPDYTKPPVGGIDLDRLLQGSGPPPQRPYGYIPKTLPYFPIWQGLAINTAFYALVFFICVRLVKGTRHLMRYRRGRCPRCGYDLLATFTAPCPECGHLTPKLMATSR